MWGSMPLFHRGNCHGCDSPPSVGRFSLDHASVLLTQLDVAFSLYILSFRKPVLLVFGSFSVTVVL